MSRKPSNSIVSITKETAKEFLPSNGKRDIDLKALALKARKAIDGSEKSLQAAGDIANGNLLQRLWNSAEFARSVVESIGYVRDISEVNLKLSAVCNDLAAANLTHAQRIDANHLETSQQLQDVQRLTGELLQHLRTARKSALLQPIVQRLGQVDAADKAALQGWLHSFSEAIDQQYQELREKIDFLAQQPAVASEDLQPLRQQLSELSIASQNQRNHAEGIDAQLKRVEQALYANYAEQEKELAQFFAELAQQKDLAAQSYKELDRTLRQSHAKLGDALTRLSLGVADLTRSLETERAEREAHIASLLQALAQSETALRSTIKALNLHWLKRFIWGGGSLLLLQVLAFAFLASKIGGG